MQTSRPYNNEIIVIDEFLSHSESNLIAFFIQNLNSTKYWSEANDQVSDHLKNKVINLFTCSHPSASNMQTLTTTMNKKAERILADIGIFNSETSLLLGFNQIIKIDNVGMDSHKDNPDNSDKPISHGIIVYLNDDYAGGELDYTELGILHKPKKNSLVIHPGTKEYTHAVRDVTSGARYAMTTFIKNK